MNHPSEISFFLNFEPNPPTVTHQEKKVRVVRGKPVFYMPPELANARALLAAKLKAFAPPAPWNCPIKLCTMWIFSFPRYERVTETPRWKITKPDTDNLQKMLKDVMTECGFWKDDALVCVESVEKMCLPPGKMHGIAISISNLEDP